MSLARVQSLIYDIPTHSHGSACFNHLIYQGNKMSRVLAYCADLRFSADSTVGVAVDVLALLVT